jgi:hypothetical protein
MAFFMAAGIERLCFGVTKRTASAALIRSRNSVHAAGGSLISVLVVDRQVPDLDDAELESRWRKFGERVGHFPID